MSSPDGVLAAIDACLEDYSVSDDAMRWAPDEPGPTPCGAARAWEWAGWTGADVAFFDETHIWDRRRTEEAAFALEPWQRYWIVSRHGEEVIVRPAPVVQVQREATERLWRWSVFGSPMALADTVFGAMPPEPTEDAPSDPPALPSPVLPPVDGSHYVAFSESAQHALGTVCMPPSGGAPKPRRTRRRNT